MTVTITEQEYTQLQRYARLGAIVQDIAPGVLDELVASCTLHMIAPYDRTCDALEELARVLRENSYPEVDEDEPTAFAWSCLADGCCPPTCQTCSTLRSEAAAAMPLTEDELMQRIATSLLQDDD